MTCVQFFSSKITPPYCTALIHVKIKNIILLHKQYKKMKIYSNSPTKLGGGGEGSQAGNDAKLKESQASDRGPNAQLPQWQMKGEPNLGANANCQCQS